MVLSPRQLDKGSAVGQHWPSALPDGGREGAKLWKAKQGVILGSRQGLVHWMVMQQWLKSWVMMDGSTTVDVSPRSWSF